MERDLLYLLPGMTEESLHVLATSDYVEGDTVSEQRSNCSPTHAGEEKDTITQFLQNCDVPLKK